MEKWKDVVGYEGLYQISNLGRVKTLNYRKTGNEKILKPKKEKGYLRIGLYNDDKCKTCLVHRLVAQAFIPNPNNFKEVNHKDENKGNNCVENLEWCDREYNNNYGTRNERSVLNRINHPSLSKKVKCLETGIVYQSTVEAERQTGIANSSISKCCLGKRKTAGGFHWKHI